MKKIFCFFCLLFALTNCEINSENKVGMCCDKIYTNTDSALSCLGRTVDGHGTTADERLLLIALVHKELAVNQKLGWEILKDKDVIETVKNKYALVILDAKQYQIIECNSNVGETLKKNGDKPVFVIVNQALCWFGSWTFDEDKENIIYKLQIGDGP